MQGVLNILKPPHTTSHDVVAIARRVLGTKKIGHTGTLDPMAAGVLPICIGRATKIVDLIQEDKKTYRCEMTLGTSTDTQDMWGEVLESAAWDLIDINKVKNAASHFIGDIEQIPPMFSALKVNGRKLYELAREGVVIDRKPRVRTIYSIEVLRMEDNKVWMDVTCSKGTYIRTICHDIGQKLGCGAHMSFLLRTKTGIFTLENAITLETLQSFKAYPDRVDAHLLSVDEALFELDEIRMPLELEDNLRNGAPYNLSEYCVGLELHENQLIRAYTGDNFLGIAKCRSTNPPEVKIETLFNIL